MATFSNIAGQEPSTVSFRVGTITVARGSTTEHQEILCLGDPDSSIAIAAVLNAAPASTAWGLVTRPLLANSTGAPAASDTGLVVRQVGYSTTVSVANTVTVQGNSTVSIVGPTSTAAPATSDTGVIVRQVGYSTVVSVANTVTIQGNSTVALAAGSAVAINGPVSTAAPAASDTGVVVRQVGYSTVVSVANTVTIQGNSTVIIGTNLQSSAAPSSASSGLVVREVIDARVTAVSTSAFATSTQFTISGSTAQTKYITAYSITSTDLTASVVRFMEGSTLRWPVRLQATSSAITGANLACGGPGYLFSIAAASSATLHISGSSRAGWTVGVSYYLAP